MHTVIKQLAAPFSKTTSHNNSQGNCLHRDKIKDCHDILMPLYCLLVTV